LHARPPACPALPCAPWLRSDLSSYYSSRFVHPMGQDGSQMSMHYDNLLAPWANGGYLPMAFDTPSDDGSFDITQLQPA
jgi:acyl-homoserine lactone acylase PvdQ